MSVKYRIPYRNHFNDLCRIDILHDSYVGTPIMLRGVAEKACIISWDCASDEPYEPIVNSKASINIYQTEDYPIDILELQEAEDREFGVEVYIEDVLKFKGFMIPDGIQRTFQSAPFELNINATDGLMLLDGLPYVHNNLMGDRCILNYLRQILFSSNNLNLALPILWAIEMVNDANPEEPDIFSGSVRWAPRGEGFTDYAGNRKNCLYILEEMLRSMQCRIAQTDGKWVIWRINDVASGSFLYKQTPATLSGFEIITGSVEDWTKSIGGDFPTYDYRFIEEDAILTVNPALKTVVTTYEQEQRDNVLPNGNMDIVNTISNSPIYWYAGFGSSATIQSVPSLSDAAGSAVEVTNAAPNPDATFTLDWLPIDTDILYTYINFGFKFSIINGATLDPDGYIVWASTPFEVMVQYDDGSGDLNLLYLNEFGFWTHNVETININVASLKLGDVAEVDFNKRQNVIMPLPLVTPIGRTGFPKIKVIFFIPSGRKVQYDDVYINVEGNSDVYETTKGLTTNTGKQNYALKISSAHSGFQVSNYMSNYDQSGDEKFFSDSKVSGVTLTEMNSNAILRNRHKPSLIFDGSIYARNYKYSEIYTIQTLDDKKFLPLKSSWNTETNTTDLTAIEVRDDVVSMNTKHYGVNDKTVLSN